LFATFGITYRYSMWLQRPPTWVLFKRGWQTFLRRKAGPRNVSLWFKKVFADFVFNLFIFKRGIGRGIAHMLIMWGCLLAFGITFPLVFGWIHFETAPGAFDQYIAHFFGFPVATMHVDGTLAFLIFHALVWASFLLLPGILLAMRRRMREHGAATGQTFGEDILPLLLLFAITVTGLLLWVSYTWMHGYAYEFLAIFHAATVIFTLLWLPFGKFFHIFQRPAQLGAAFYKDAGNTLEQMKCKRCGQPYMSVMHAEDLAHVEERLGYDYSIPDADAGHYQFICPPCKRALLATAQRELFRRAATWT
jgi:hypothetical protein